MAILSDTTNKNGLIQKIERWTGLGDGGISGNATLLLIIIDSLNDAYDEIWPLLSSYLSNTLRFDDANNADLPVATFGIVSGQSDYTLAEDDNSLDILNVISVRIKSSASGSIFVPLDEVTLDDPLVPNIMNPSSGEVGVPTSYLKNGSKLYLYPQPNYTNAAGLEISFERQVTYLSQSNLTQEPGIPRPFHPLLAMIAAHEYLVENKGEETVRITRLEAKIAIAKTKLSALISKRNPTRAVMKMRPVNYL